jgi:serine protease AprX
MAKRNHDRKALAVVAFLLVLTGVAGPLQPSTVEAAARAIASFDGATQAKLSPMVFDAAVKSDPNAPIQVVVTTANAATSLDETTAATFGARVLRRFENINGYAVSISPNSLAQLAALPNITRVSMDQKVGLTNDLNYVTLGADIARKNLGLNGHDVVVAVLDSGIANHPDVGGRLLTEVEIVGRESGYADYFGHGTHLAGIIAGNAHESSDGKSFRRFYGIAPEAKLVSVRVLGRDGTGYVSDVIAGIDWVIKYRANYKIRVLNISLGQAIEQSYATDPLCIAVEKAWKAGIVVVVSAGNFGELGYGTIGSPGNDPYVITVGASNNYLSPSRGDDILTTYTSRGPTAIDHFVKPDLVAPGNRTVSLRALGSTLDSSYPALRVKYSAFNTDPNKANLDSPYFELSGSSMATAVVSGMAAILIQAEPSITPDTVKARFMKSAEKRLEYDIFSEGAGFANLYAALQERGIAKVPSLSPRAFMTSTGIVIQSTDSLWGDPLSWNSTLIWGGEPLRNTDAVAANGAVWGNKGTVGGSGVGTNGAIWGGNNSPPRR